MQKSQVSRVVRPPALSAPKQKHVRLSKHQQAELVQRHRDGAFKKELARVYGIHVETVREIIKRHGAQWEVGLSPAQIESAAECYAAGDSLATIARSLGVAANTVRTRLLAQGVTMRSTSGARPLKRDPLSANGGSEL